MDISKDAGYCPIQTSGGRGTIYGSLSSSMIPIHAGSSSPSISYSRTNICPCSISQHLQQPNLSHICQTATSAVPSTSVKQSNVLHKCTYTVINSSNIKANVNKKRQCETKHFNHPRLNSRVLNFPNVLQFRQFSAMLHHIS